MIYGNAMQRMLNARNPQMGAPNQMQARLPVYSQIAAQMSQPQTAAPMQSGRMTIPRQIMRATSY